MTRDEPSVESRLDSFLADGHIAEVLHIIKGGKEGVVYCCRGGPLAGADLVAAKVYHQLERRAFRDDAVYQESRLRGPRQRRERLAMAKKSSFGRKVQFGIWARSEFETLAMLRAAGADVPSPIACNDGALLMEYIGDHGRPAPPLARVEIAHEQAPRLLADIVRNVALWLGVNRVHADLSPYNVLYWRGRLTVIDFPQAIDPRFNPNARALLERDLTNICHYFDRFGAFGDPNRIARRLWEAFRHGQPLA